METALSGVTNGSWAMANLFLLVLVITLCVGELMSLAKSGDATSVRSRLLSLLTVLPAAIVVVAFALMQNLFGGSVSIVDNVTVIMGASAVAQLALLTFSHLL